MITIYLVVSLWIAGNSVKLEMTRQADLAECLNGVAKAIANNDDLTTPEGTKFRYRISAACVLERTPADPA